MSTAVIDHPRVLRTVKDYDAAVTEIHRILDLDPKTGSREDELLELLSLLVEDYETRHIPEPPSGTPQSVVEFMLEQKGLTRADLAAPLGGKSRVSEFFAGKRPLSTGQIRSLRTLLGIPADLLLEADDQKPRTTRVDSMAHRPRGVVKGMGASAPKKKAAKRIAALRSSRKK